MKRSMFFTAVVAALIGLTASPALAAEPSLAYLDPASGSLIVSAIIGGAAAIAMFVKRFWFRIVRVFRGKSSEPVG